MDAMELLRSWPDVSKANASRILHSPAWRMMTRFGGEPASLTRRETSGDCSLVLDVRFDEKPATLALRPSPLFADLWLLKDRFADLPREVLLALVEKECGEVFQFLEDVFRCSLSVVGVSDRAAEGTTFALSREGDGFEFALELTPSMELQLGHLENLDVSHEVVRSLTREAFVRHAVVPLPAEEAASLAPGDFLVLPDGVASAWTLELPADDSAQVVSAERGVLTFAQLADDDLPPVPEPANLEVVRRGKTLARVELAQVGEAAAVRVVEAG